MDAIISNFCQTCLSNERLLYPAHKLSFNLYNLGICLKIDDDSGVCWECKATIMKFLRFKAQVLEAQKALAQIIKYEQLKSLSQLSHHNKYVYDLEVQYSDPLTNSEAENKDVTIKLEADTEIFIDEHTLECDGITSAEEEMLKNREEKRNQPNFKKIPYKCDSCVLGFTRRETYEMHVEKKHGESVGQHCCGVCECRFPSAKLLERHTRKHYVVHRCLLCDHVSLELWSAVGHCRAKHSGDSSGSIHCTQCTAVFRYASPLVFGRVCSPSGVWKSKHCVVNGCLFCDHVSLELWSAVGHCRAKHSGDSSGSIHCPQCTAVFRYASPLVFGRVSTAWSTAASSATTSDSSSGPRWGTAERSTAATAAAAYTVHSAPPCSGMLARWCLEDKHCVVNGCLFCDHDNLELWSAVGHCRAKHSGDSSGSIHCPQCTAVFRLELWSAVGHCRAKHNGDSSGSIHCPQCTAVFRLELWSAVGHCRAKHSGDSSGSIHCPQCTAVFRLELWSAVGHCRAKHSGDSSGSIHCPQCTAVFRLELWSAVGHCRAKHSGDSSGSIHCPQCTAVFRLELWSAVGHCRAKHSGDSSGSIHCPQCTAVFRTPQALSDHIKSQHTLRCNVCGDEFKGKHTLRTHKMRIHGARRDFACDACGKTFKTKSRLESHVAGHNAALAKKLAFCAVCNVQYKNIYVYRNHLKNSANHSERSYECKECGKKFASKVYWRKHCEFYHQHKSQYKCEICNKLFISDWRLKNHGQTHHGLGRSRNHVCNVCGKKFFTLSTLRGHQLTHSEQRSYMCEDCGDTFKQRPALYTHARLVHRGGKRKK
ncbi:unnamed protein product, partial [Iphiclides podalirius]